MENVRVGVIGVGYLGQFHAEKYARQPHVDLVGVVDADPARAASVAAKTGTRHFTKPEDLIGNVDAVSIVVPTVQHYRIAKGFIEHDVHVMVEKPITATIEQADELIELAARKGVVLQVGHIERFNPAITAIKPLVASPHYMQAERSAPFTIRCTDVNVVLDLMIHDLDIVRNVAGAEPKEVCAAGTSVITREIDAVNARIVFHNGCVADIAASRVSDEKRRVLKVFDGGTLYTSDYQAQKAYRSHRGNGSNPEFVTAEIPTERKDTLQEEVASFIRCVLQHERPLVSGIEGRNALALARLITRNIESGITAFVAVPRERGAV